MPVWEHITEGSIDHYADVPNVEAWAHNALDLASEANERRLSEPDASRDEQALTLVRAIDALATAYRAANISPTTEPRWLSIMRDAYGPTAALGGTSVSDGSAGWIPRQARDVFRAVTGNVGTSFKTYARLWLAPEGQPRTSAIEDDAIGAQFAPSVAWAGRAHPDGAACTDPMGDWQCEAWSSPPGGENVLLLPPAVWSLGLVRLAAQSILAGPRAWMMDALRNGAAPIVDGVPPNDSSIDSPIVVRPPAPAPAPGPSPAPAPSPDPPPAHVTSGEAATFGPIILGAALIGGVLLLSSARSTRRARR